MMNLHLSRRIQHLLTGLAILSLSYVIPPYPLGSALLSAATLAFYFAHRRRLHDYEYDTNYLRQFGGLLREEERGEWILDDGSQCDKMDENGKLKYRRKSHPILPGAFYFLLGTAMSSALFTTRIAQTSLLVLSVSDPAAGFAGVWFANMNCNITWSRLWGIVRGEKGMNIGPTVVGSLACGISTLLCTYVYFPKDYPHLDVRWRIIVGVVVSIVEAAAGRCMMLPVDDNLLIPLVAGGLLTWLVQT